MENNENNRKGVVFLLEKTLDQDLETRRKAEQDLLNLTGKPGFAVLLLAILQDSSIALIHRQSASAYFKNYVRKHWDSTTTIQAEEKDMIKKIVPELMLSVDAPLRRLVTASLCEISNQDFPDNWPTLLPSLVEKLNTQDYNQINGVLKVCNSIFKRFRFQVNSDVVLLQLKTVLASFAAPMLNVFMLTCQQVQAQAANPAALQVLFTSVRMLVGIFYSLNYVDLPEYFEDHMNDYFGGFKMFLTYETQHQCLLQGKNDQSPGLLHKVQSMILDNVNLYVEKYEEEFKNLLQHFVQDTWGLLMKTPNDARFDSLVTSALQFLTSVATGVAYTIFQDPAALSQICEKIIAPNLRLRKSDKEEFEDDPLAYVRKDVEGSDSGTRRRSAYAFIKGLRRNFEDSVTNIFRSYIEALLAEHAVDKNKNWAAKDAAVYLVIALATKKSSQAKGVIELNAAIPVDAFFKSQVLPELQSDVNKQLLLKASCLTFVNTFRRQWTEEDWKALIPLLISYLGVDSFVIRSYASICIERFLSIQLEGPGTYKWGKQHIQPFLGPLLNALFTALEPKTNTENHYVMKAIARVLAVSREDVPSQGFIFAVQCISEKIGRLYKAPVNPEFGHFLFEALAAVITTMCKDKSNLNNMETVLLPIFHKILVEPDSDTFSPYVFQIMSLLIELRGVLPDMYVPLLPELVKAKFWEENGNHPALVRLLQAYIANGPQSVIPQLPSILGVFQRLVSSKRNDFLGFYLLESIVNHLEASVFSPYLTEVFRIVFTRIQGSKTVQLIKSFVIFLCTFSGKHGIGFVVDNMNKLQDGIFWMVLKSLWIPNLHGISGKLEKKAVAVGSTKILCEFPALLQGEGRAVWVELVQGIIKLFGGAEESTPTADYQEEVEDLVYNSGFSNLKYASKSEVDYFSGIKDERAFFISSFQQLAAKAGAEVSPLVASLGPDFHNALRAIFGAYQQNVPFLP